MKRAVFIPTYCCEKQIKRVLDGFSPELLSLVERVIIVDNSSPEATIAVALAEIASRTKLERLKFEVRKNRGNFGLGGTFKVAWALAQQSKYDSLIFLHGDNQAPTDEIFRLVEVQDKNPTASAWLGSRFSLGSKREGYSRARTFGNFGLNLLYSVAAGRIISDLGSGLTAYNINRISETQIGALPSDVTFDAVLLCMLLESKSQIEFFPIRWQSREEVSTVQNIDVGILLLRILAQWKGRGIGTFYAPINPSELNLESDLISDALIVAAPGSTSGSASGIVS